jgi:predicted lipoprotein with Yx(FWY)xxD motif
MRIRSIAISALVGASLVVSACSASTPAAPTTAPAAPTTAAAAPTTAATAAASPSSAAAPTTAATTPTAAAATTPAAAPTTAAGTTPAAAATTAAQPAQNPATRVSGSVASVAGDKITLTDGTSFTVPSTVRIISTVPAKASDLKVGDYVAVTAKRQPDNTLLASIVNVFPPEMKGVGIGQRPMTGGNLMTNATISSVSANGFTVTFPGGGAQVTLAPDAQINTFKLVNLSDVATGMPVSALVADGVARSLAILPASAATAAAPSGATVSVVTDPKLGPILVASNGRTLYKFANDKPNTSNCTGGCASVWPPYTATGTPSLPTGVSGTIGMITRADGTQQLTYNGSPLYLYAKDSKAGDTNGQGVAGKWSVVAPSS